MVAILVLYVLYCVECRESGFYRVVLMSSFRAIWSHDCGVDISPHHSSYINAHSTHTHTHTPTPFIYQDITFT